MKKASVAVVATLAPALLLVSMLPGARRPAKPPRQETTPQEIQKPKNDYMSGFISRSTQPLGLKDNPEARRMMAQGAVKWSVRAGSRHILD